MVFRNPIILIIPKIRFSFSQFGQIEKNEITSVIPREKKYFCTFFPQTDIRLAQ